MVCSMTNTIRPYFFENGSIKKEIYKRMLWHYVFPWLRTYPEDMAFQQNGATPYDFVAVQ